MTFVRNARSFGLRKAWKIDRDLTFQLNPNLERTHKCGMEMIGYFNNRYDQVLEGSESQAGYDFWRVVRFPNRIMNKLIGYPVGFLLGVIGIKPEEINPTQDKNQGQK